MNEACFLMAQCERRKIMIQLCLTFWRTEFVTLKMHKIFSLIVVTDKYLHYYSPASTNQCLSMDKYSVYIFCFHS